VQPAQHGTQHTHTPPQQNTGGAQISLVHPRAICALMLARRLQPAPACPPNTPHPNDFCPTVPVLRTLGMAEALGWMRRLHRGWGSGRKQRWWGWGVDIEVSKWILKYRWEWRSRYTWRWGRSSGGEPRASDLAEISHQPSHQLPPLTASLPHRLTPPPPPKKEWQLNG
jgi:hypothetical protein